MQTLKQLGLLLVCLFSGHLSPGEVVSAPGRWWGGVNPKDRTIGLCPRCKTLTARIRV